MADRDRTETKDHSPPPARPGTAGPPFSAPQADENYPPPPGLEPEQRPAKRWWSFGREVSGARDVVPLAILLVVAVLLFLAFATGWWW